VFTLAHLFAGFWLFKTLLLGRLSRRIKVKDICKAEEQAANVGPQAGGSVDVCINIISSSTGVTGNTPQPQDGSTASCCLQAVTELVWTRVGCSYRSHGTNKVVLKNVWGAALSGEVQVRFLCWCK
jgi:hypothetical protein